MGIDIQQLQRRWDALREARQPYDAAWQELAAHFLPTRFRAENAENKPILNSKLVDATGILAMRTLAAGLHGGLTSPARPWFRLTLHDKDLAKSAAMRVYLDEVASRMRSVLHRSNFYNIVHTLYAELGTFGTGFVFEVAQEDGLRFIPLSAGEYALDVDASQRVDTVIRRMQMTARQMAQFFGREVLPEIVLRALDRGLHGERFVVLHAVWAQDDLSPWSEDGVYAPFRSVYWMEGAHGSHRQTVLREAGFCEFPGFGPRWDCPGNDVYGRSPAMDALPDCRMLQQMGITTLKGIHKAVDPPMSVNAGLKAVGLDLTPGGINYVETAPGQAPMAAAPLVHANPDIAQARKAMEAVQKQIQAGLHNDLFRLIMDGRSGVTAREIAAREEEKLILIGPVLERLHDELFTPLIHRTYCLMQRLDMLPPRPPVPEGTALDVEFVSLLAQAQKLVSTTAVDQYLAFAANAGSVWPEALDCVNIDRVADSYADYLGLESSLLRAPEERTALRVARAKEQERHSASQGTQHAVQQIKEVAGIVKTLSETETAHGTALEALGQLAGTVLPSILPNMLPIAHMPPLGGEHSQEEKKV